jgi:hypothetical protein
MRSIFLFHGFVAAAALATSAIAIAPARAATFVDTFTGGANSAGWNFGSFNADVIESSGGNPGAWLHNNLLDTFAPILSNDPTINSNFNGNLRAKGVSSIGVDARTDHADFGAGGRNFSLLLRDTKGTPNDADDDDYAYFVGPEVPQVGQGWVSYDFPVPSQSTAALPPGWTGGYSGDPEHFRPGVDWNNVITHADSIEFWWLNPAFFAIFQQWDVGVDNVRVTSIPEPASLMSLSAIGAGAVLLRRRRSLV